jgi:hypothetical protein
VEKGASILTFNRRTKTVCQDLSEKAADGLIGSKVSVQVGDELLEGKVTAVLRILASDVKALSAHVMDMVSYLAKTYPDGEFDQLEALELLLYFCGRRLATEAANPTVGASVQSRIIVAIDF